MSERLTHALPIDVARQFDHTTTQTQLENNTFQGSPDDRDVLAGLIEDAEGEFEQQTDVDMRLSRAGTPGRRETFEQLTYKIAGHESYKRNWSGVSGNYLPQEVEKNLQNGRVLPFDAAEGDKAYLYRGLGGSRTDDGWEDVTDDYGSLWQIIDHREGMVVFHPLELERTMRSGRRGVSMGRSRLNELRFAVSYRYGTLGGSRGSGAATSLTASLDATTTGTVGVEDGASLPGGGDGGSYVFKIGSEYVDAVVDVENDLLDVRERGVRGTNAESHAAGARVQYTPSAIRKAVSARAGMGLIQSGRYSGWLPDNDDDLDKRDVLDRLEQTWQTTIEVMQ